MASIINNNNSKKNADTPVSSSAIISFQSVFVTKDAYRQVAMDFYPCHSQELNLILHVLGASVQMWGVVQLLLHCDLAVVVHVFMVYVLATTPLATGILHTLCLVWFLWVPLPAITININIPININITNIDPAIASCFLAMACGLLKDVGHYVCNEPPFMGEYLKTKPYMFFFHATWHLPFLMDAYSPFSTVLRPLKKKL
jgi:hypothetical protein